MLENAHERLASFLCDNYPQVVPSILDYMRFTPTDNCYDDLIQMMRSIHEDNDLPGLTAFIFGLEDDHGAFVYNLLYDVFDGNVFDEIFGTSTYYPVLQQALFHCAARTDIQNFFLAWAPFNMGVLRTVVGDAYLMYLVYNAYPSFFTTQVMDNIGVEEFYRAFERMANFNISDLMALLQNSMDPARYDDFAASVPSFLTYEEKISLSEHYIYGSQRLGAKKATKQLQSHTLQYESGNWLPQEVNYMAEPVPAYVAKAGGLVDVGYGLGTWLANGKLKYPQEATYTRKLGFKEYELTNHLGNVQATILDRRLGIKAHPSDTIFSYVEADVKTVQDYYPFGMMMPGRSYTVGTAQNYRYGMNAQEKDDEIYGIGNSYTAEFWQYDARLGRRWNLDPKPNHSISLYNCFASNPILFGDPNGDTIRVAPENQGYYIEDLSKVFGPDANLLFTFNENNDLELTRAGQIKAFREQSIGTNKGKLYSGVLKLMNSDEVTNIVYTNGPIINPQTGSPYENDKGHKLTIPVQNKGGEATMTITDAKAMHVKNVTQNTVTILKDLIHSPGIYNDPRENNTFHGMGHVLFQKNSEQESVIDFDNRSRSETGAPVRPVDADHKNKPD